MTTLDYTEICNQIATELIKKGWKDIKFSTKLSNSIGTYDVVAKSKGLRKKLLVICIGSDPNDATLASMLLNGVEIKSEKFIFLLTGDPRFVETFKDIEVISEISQLPSS